MVQGRRVVAAAFDLIRQSDGSVPGGFPSGCLALNPVEVFLPLLGEAPLLRYSPGKVEEADPKRRGLQLVKPVRPADQVMRLTVCGSVVAEQADPRSDLVVVGRHRSAITDPWEVLGGVEAEGGRSSQRASHPALVFGSHGLACVLDQRSNMEQLVYRRGVAEEVNRDDRDRPLGDLLLCGLRCHHPRFRIDVGEDRNGAGVDDRLSGGDEGQGRNQHLAVQHSCST